MGIKKLSKSSGRLYQNYKNEDSPSEQLRKELPRGAGNWPGYDIVYGNLQKGAFSLAQGQYTYLSDLHIKTMAVLGTGHEETMKAQQMLLRAYQII